MSSTQPPVGPPDPSTPDPNAPPAGATPPPPPPPVGDVPPPPPPAPSAPSYGTPPPPAAPSYGATPPPAPAYGAPPAPGGVPRPGELLDRFVGRLIDLIIVGIVGFVINLILAIISDSWLLANFVSAIVDTALYLGYFAYLESNRGQTIGKQLMKLKVFGPDGRSLPTMNEAVKRNIWLGAAILGIIPILGSLVGGLIEIVAIIVCAVGINSDAVRRQHWFDKFASGTQVMKIG